MTKFNDSDDYIYLWRCWDEDYNEGLEEAETAEEAAEQFALGIYTDDDHIQVMVERVGGDGTANVITVDLRP